MSTERRGRFRIERVCDEARTAGYGHAWHVYDDDDLDPYVGTFPTREEARHHVRQALAAEGVTQSCGYDGTAETQYDDMTDDDLRRMHASEARGERGPVYPGLAEPVWGLEQP